MFTSVVHYCVIIIFKRILFMQDECSFVSLRDVDRAMIVFEYFYDKMALFGPLMEEWAEQHETDDDIDVLNHVC